jgi:hypothetical protein
VDRALLAELVPLLERRVAVELSITEGHLYVTMNGRTSGGTIERLAIAAA